MRWKGGREAQGISFKTGRCSLFYSLPLPSRSRPMTRQSPPPKVRHLVRPISVSSGSLLALSLRCRICTTSLCLPSSPARWRNATVRREQRPSSPTPRRTSSCQEWTSGKPSSTQSALGSQPSPPRRGASVAAWKFCLTVERRRAG